MTEAEIRKAIEYIGANIQTYNHFDIYMIPDESGSELFESVSRDRLLKLIYEYYNKKDRFTPSDLFDTTDAKNCKRFLKNRVNDQSYQVGLDWLNRQEGIQ